jgi:hypothetical protein
MERNSRKNASAFLGHFSDQQVEASLLLGGRTSLARKLQTNVKHYFDPSIAQYFWGRSLESSFKTGYLR